MSASSSHSKQSDKEKKSRKALFTPPWSSSKKNTKRQRTGSDDLNQAVIEERGMDQDMATGGQEHHEPLVDAMTMTTVIKEQIDNALKDVYPTMDKNDPLCKLLPALTMAVTVGVSMVMKMNNEALEKKLVKSVTEAAAPRHDPVMVANLRKLTYDNDRLQQYTRRESVRIWGIKTERNEKAEDVEKRALEIIHDAGVDCTPDDLQAVHRAGKEKDGIKPVLVKFVSRRKRRQLMVSKKVLKGKEGYDGIYINDDLTPLRSRMLGYVKKLEVVDKAWTIDGKIMVKKTGAKDTDRPTVIEDPDDIFQLGVDSIDYKKLGLEHLAFAGIDDEEDE